MTAGIRLMREGTMLAAVRQLELGDGRCSFVAVGGPLLRSGSDVYELVEGSGKVRRIRIVEVEVSGGTSSSVVTAELLTDR